MRWIATLLLWCLCMYAYSNSIIVGTAPENPPFSFQADKNHFFGFEIDIMNEICHRTHIQCHYKPVVADSILKKLVDGKIDFALAGLFLPQKTPRGFIFSIPYLQTDGQLIALKKSSITTMSDLKDKTIGIKQGLLSKNRLFKRLANEFNQHHAKLKEYHTMHALLDALNNHEIDVIFSSEVLVKYWYSNHKNMYKLIGKPIPMDNKYSIISCKKYEFLMHQMDKALLDMTADGTYEKIYRRYFSQHC